MKPHFIAFALIAFGAGLSALATWQMQPLHPLQRHPVVAPIDLVSLQQQADAALDQLRQDQQHRPAQAPAER